MLILNKIYRYSCLYSLAAVFFAAIFTLGNTSAIAGDRLLATGGVAQIEGAAGGGLTPWALITGYGTDAQIGGSAFYTQAKRMVVSRLILAA